MNRILNIGSLNIDHVYRVPSFVEAGETLASSGYSKGPGGKGLNQSLAAARAGAEVAHAGCIGADGGFLLNLLTESGVDVKRVLEVPGPTGHAIIQVSPEGENAIILHPGANHAITGEKIAPFFEGFGEGDWLILQNEASGVARMISEGKRRGLKVVLNPAPMTPEVNAYPLDQVDLLICNEPEAAGLSGMQSPERALEVLTKRWPQCEIVLTLGSRGCMYHGKDGAFPVPAERVAAVDTTAAGDTFAGYLVAGLTLAMSRREALEWGSRAAAITVQRPGAAVAIPWSHEVKRDPQ